MTSTNNDDNVNSDEDPSFVPLLAAKLSNVAKDFTREGVSPELVVKSFETARDMAVKRTKELSVSMEGFDVHNILSTFLAPQLRKNPFGPYRQHLAKLFVAAVLATDADDRPFDSSIDDFEDDSDLIELKKIPGGKVEDSFVVEGALFKWTVSRGADEFDKLKVVSNPNILCLKIKPDRKLKKKNHKRHFYANIYDMVDKYVNHGANVVLSTQAIGDLTRKYLKDRDIIYADRLDTDDLERVAFATDARMISSNYFSPPENTFGTAKCFEEKKFGNEVFGIFSGCSIRKTATLVLHGDDEFIEETEVHLPEVIEFLRKAMKDYTLVDGRTLYTEISQYLYEKAEDVAKDSQPIIKAFAEAIKAFAEAIKTFPDRRYDNVGCVILEPPSLKIGIIRVATQLVLFELCCPTSSDDEETSSKKKRKRAKRKRRH